MPDNNDQEDRSHHSDNPKSHPITVSVNGKPVIVTGPKTTGLAIKTAAVAVGVIPDVGFQLSIERGNGEIIHVADDKQISVRSGEAFLAVAPDDNS
jgi:hypothetical protein